MPTESYLRNWHLCYVNGLPTAHLTKRWLAGITAPSVNRSNMRLSASAQLAHGAFLESFYGVDNRDSHSFGPPLYPTRGGLRGALNQGFTEFGNE